MASSARSQAKSTIREFDLIRALKRRYQRTGAGILRGIGDDAAVIALGRNRHYLFTTDLLAEGIHFERRVFQAMFGTADQKEGMAAFVEKRKPGFKNC